VAGLVDSGAYEAHVERLRLRGSGRAVTRWSPTLREHLPPEFRSTCPDGGVVLRGTLPSGYPEEEAVRVAAEAGAPVIPGSRFGRGPAPAIRLSCSVHSPDQLGELVRAVDVIARLTGAAPPRWPPSTR
jgi:DNA-binding transcriptional MocR family regulator